MELSSDVGEVFTYYTQGQLVKSGSNFDLAIQDNSADPNAKIKLKLFLLLMFLMLMESLQNITLEMVLLQ